MPPGPKRRVSVGGGNQPGWRGDGKEIFFVATDRQLMAAEVRINGDRLEVGAVKRLFGPLIVNRGYMCDVSADGQLFSGFGTAAAERAIEPMILIQNWTASLLK